MNPKYSKQVKEAIDRPQRVGFIHLPKKAIWISPLVRVPKKVIKIMVCEQN